MAYGSILHFLFLSLFFVLISNPCYSETDTLHQDQQLKDWDELISTNRVFCLKFFSFGTSVSPYLGVFYRENQIRAHYLDELRVALRCNQIRSRYWDNFIKKSFGGFSNTPVWVANRNSPIPDSYGKLIIDENGKLSILSSGGTVHDLFSPTELVARNASVTLLDSGNLKLQELHPDGSVKRVLWQSFDYPTDTLLPGMKLGINLKTGHNWSLTSWRNDELPAEGLFKLVGDFNGTGQMVILRQGNVHWASGPWQNGEFKNTDLQSSGPDVRLYYVSNETEQSFTYLTRTYDSYPALRMHQDGQLKGSPLNLNLQCLSIDDPPGCAEDLHEKIECRKDYNFGSPQVQKYYGYDFGDEHVYNESFNLYDCQRICWSNCSCVAYTTTKGRIGCKTYGTNAYAPQREIVHEYYYTFDYHGGYVEENKETKKKKKKSKAWIGLIIMIVPLVILLSCYWVYKNIDVKGIAINVLWIAIKVAKKTKKLYLLQMRRMRLFYMYVRTDKYINTELHYFTFQSISSATNNFSSTNKLGKGGYGEVFKGLLGYMPPEYLIDGIISTKIDVYGFGVLLLEIISSKMNNTSYDVEHPLNLLGLRHETETKAVAGKGDKLGNGSENGESILILVSK
ncbi:hypothetical protein L1987_48328 [Smallanthus sonchifolius]|uniref:Uncharacterized protein n=1 Tax=Smallanthus sonchifolius TaxID=185202 RepID=A0ACB9FSK2_9ASTR|nr:hypothetical protein L1987_48328 [Smallanthus sonchifolius]